MKNKTIIGAIVSAIAILFLISGCASPAPLSKFESSFLNSERTTNYVTKVETNFVAVPVPVFVTNIQTILQTNSVGVTVPVFQTNVLTSWQTNLATVYQTNTAAQISQLVTPGNGAKDVIAVGSGAGALFGVGQPVALGLSLLFGLWAKMRSSRNYATSANLAQSVETLREFIKSLPNGAATDTAVTNWLQQHQSEAGVTAQVLTLLSEHVNNDNAQFAAQQLASLVGVIQANPVPPTSPLTPLARQ